MEKSQIFYSFPQIAAASFSYAPRIYFFSCVLVSQIVLFFSGNIQNFLDENLNLILFSICCASIGTGFFALAACLECIFYIISTKKIYFYVHLIIFIVFFILAVFICLASNSIEILSGGLVKK